jgi:signal peptidase I
LEKKVLAVTLIAVGVVLVLVSGFGLVLVLVQKTDYGYFFALSSSMEPAFGKGECVKVELNVNINDVYVAPKSARPPGDTIAFRKPTYPSDTIIHRAVESGTDTSYYLVTQGDANPGPDGWRVRQADFVGRVVEINPPFWTYNYIFWGAVFAIGLAILLIGIIMKVRSQKTLTRSNRDYVI